MAYYGARSNLDYMTPQFGFDPQTKMSFDYRPGLAETNDLLDPLKVDIKTSVDDAANKASAMSMQKNIATPEIKPGDNKGDDKGWLGNSFSNLGNTMDTIGGLMDMWNSFQANSMKRKELALKEKSVNHNIAMSTKSFDNKVGMYNNQLGRGAGSRASVSGGKDPMSKLDKFRK